MKKWSTIHFGTHVNYHLSSYTIRNKGTRAAAVQIRKRRDIPKRVQWRGMVYLLLFNKFVFPLFLTNNNISSRKTCIKQFHKPSTIALVFLLWSQYILLLLMMIIIINLPNYHQNHYESMLACIAICTWLFRTIICVMFSCLLEARKKSSKKLLSPLLPSLNILFAAVICFLILSFSFSEPAFLLVLSNSLFRDLTSHPNHPNNLLVPKE